MHDGGLQLLLSTVLRKSRVWQSTALRVFCVVHGDEEDPTALQKKMAEFLYKMRIDAEVKVVVLAEGADAPGVRDHIVGGGRNRADWLEKATRPLASQIEMPAVAQAAAQALDGLFVFAASLDLDLDPIARSSIDHRELEVGRLVSCSWCFIFSIRASRHTARSPEVPRV